MGTMDGAIGPGYARIAIDSDTVSAHRRNTLKSYALKLSKAVKDSRMNDLEAFVDIATFATMPFLDFRPEQQDAYFFGYLEDLRRLLIGDGFTNTERNKGTYALGFNAFHDSGFKKEFQDGGNQVQHAMAGIYISSTYGFLGRRFTYWLEDEAPDLALYRTSFDIGSDLDSDNFRTLPKLIKTRIGA